MFDLELEFSAKPIIFMTIIQILLITFIGVFLNIVIELFYDKLRPSYRVLKQKDYQGNLNGRPKKYRFIAVKYNEFEEIENEKFYTFFGDCTKVEYSNGECCGMSTLFFSNILLSLFPLTGILLLIVANSYEASVTQNLAELSNIQVFQNLGGLFLVSSIITGLIKLIFDFTYTGYE